MIEIVTATSSLRRSGIGSITGQVFLRGPIGDFPETGWSDFPVVVLGWWIHGLTGLASGRARLFQGMFMDGPYGFVVARDAGNVDRIAWGEVGEEASIGTVDLPALLGSAVAAGTLVAAACRTQRWTSLDLDSLERSIERTVA